MFKIELWRSDKDKRPTISNGFYHKQVIRSGSLQGLIAKCLDSRFERFSIADDRLKQGRRMEFIELGHPDNPHNKTNHTLETQLIRGDIDIDERSDVSTPEECYNVLIKPYLGPDVEVYVYPSLSNYSNKEGRGSRYHFIALSQKVTPTGAPLKGSMMQLFDSLPILDYTLYNHHHHFVDSKVNLAEGEFFGNGQRLKLPKAKKIEKTLNEYSAEVTDIEADELGPFIIGNKTFGSLYDIWDLVKNSGREQIRFDVVSIGAEGGWAMRADGSFISFHGRHEGLRGRLEVLMVGEAVPVKTVKPTSKRDLAGWIIEDNIPWSGRMHSALWTGGGKTTVSKEALREMIKTTEKTALIVLPDLKSCYEWEEAIGAGARVFRSIEFELEDGEKIWTHELSDRGISKRYSWQEQRVVIITHAKYANLFGGAYRTKISAALGYIDMCIIDERLEDFNSVAVSYDDLARLFIYSKDDRTKSQIFLDAAKFMMDHKGQKVQLTGDISGHYEIGKQNEEHLDHLYKMEEGHYGRRRNRKEAQQWFPGAYTARNKGEDNKSPAEVLKGLDGLFRGSEEIHVCKGGRAMFAFRKIMHPCQKTILLDATADVWPSTEELVVPIWHDVPRRYEAVSVTNLKVRGGNNTADAPETDKRTLLVTRKANSRNYEEKSEFQTYFGADKGTNAYREAEAVAILEKPQYPGWLEEMYEAQFPGYGARMMQSMVYVTLLQVANRGCCRTAIDEEGHCAPMDLYLPNVSSGLKQVFKDHMPGIRFLDDKHDALAALGKPIADLKWRDVKELDLFKDAKSWRNFKQTI